MHRIIEGIKHFQHQVFHHHQEHFERLTQGQSPEVLFITCSDSRVDPALITQTLPGELFVLRNAGNLIPPFNSPHGGEIATIEYAVAVLGIKDIIVCGHTHCGAINALLNPERLAELPDMAQWLAHAEGTIRTLPHDCSLLEATERNVLVQLENLLTHPAVQKRIESGELQLHGWIYHFENGNVTRYDSESEKFVELTETL